MLLASDAGAVERDELMSTVGDGIHIFGRPLTVVPRLRPVEAEQSDEQNKTPSPPENTRI